MASRIAHIGDGEHRGDRPAPHDLGAVVVQAPLDVVRMTEVRLDRPAQRREFHDLRIRERRQIPPARIDRILPGSPERAGARGDPLGRDPPGHDRSVAHPVDVGIHPSGHQRLTQAEARLHDHDPPVGRDRVGGEQHAGRARDDHPLHRHAHGNLPVVDAVPQPGRDAAR